MFYAFQPLLVQNQVKGRLCNFQFKNTSSSPYIDTIHTMHSIIYEVGNSLLHT